MINDTPYSEQFKKLFKQITKDLGYKFILSLQVFDKPRNDEGDTDYPYIGYSLLNSNQVANIVRSEKKDDDVYKWWEEQFEFIISFTAITENAFESVEVATELYNWFKNTGSHWLVMNWIVHVDSTPVTPRDYFLVNDYERRAGFDARIRMGREVELTIPRIDTVNVQNNS